MSDAFVVYGLVDPESGQLRYIGKSCCGLKRARSHAYPSYLNRDRSHCGNWIRSLSRRGLRYGIVTIQTHETQGLLSQAEAFWISYFRSMGCQLTNITDGGEGCAGRVVSESTREKMRLASLGNKNAAGKRYNLTVEQRQAAAQRARHRSADPLVRAKISTTLQGRKQSSEQVARRVASLKARWTATPKKPFSEETKAKMRSAAIRRWARKAE